MLYRDEFYHPETEERGIAELIVTKHRNGPVGTVKLLLNRNSQDIEILLLNRF